MSHDVRAQPASASQAPDRDPAVDAARVACVITVVCLHVLMVTITRDPASGEIRSVLVPTLQPWYWWATWLLQVMPLFFVVGGAATAGAWRRRRARGVAAGEYVRERTLRLVQPAAVLWCALALVAGAALAAGVPYELVTFALSGMGMALWFLAAYLICQALTPLLMRMHEQMGWVWCWFLLSGTVAVDLVRMATGQQWWGLLNMAFVWPLVQQLGFFRADGWFAARSRVTLVALAAGAYLLLGVCAASGAYAPDMLTNLNPPTVCMVLLGVAQACLLEVFSPALRRLMRWRPAQVVAHVVGTRALTIYLWHLPLVVAVMAAWFLAGGYDPAPGSAGWWWLRIPLAVLCWAVVLAVATALRRVERASVAPWGARPARLSGTALAIALVCATVPPLWEIVTLLTVPLTIAGAGGSLTAVVLLRSGRVAATDPVPSPR
ncbi:acyltransferase [Kocuria rhizophila]|uniref:acyltransferase family protein n=1 Tax=Kocuria rhizophila TaxID=72000 RepID=UPI002150696A|nr:acyltransferase [Kocuria rhizophila]MCR4526466.1 acyltransferase [Kocuria rhizophila]